MNALTLVPAVRTKFRQPLLLIIGSAPAVVDQALNALDGDFNGQAGGDFRTSFGRQPRRGPSAREIDAGSASVSAQAVDALVTAGDLQPTRHRRHRARKP